MNKDLAINIVLSVVGIVLVLYIAKRRSDNSEARIIKALEDKIDKLTA